MKGRVYSYLVTFAVAGEGYVTQSFGDVIIQRDKELNNNADIEELRKLLLSKVDGATHLCFNNIILLDEENKKEVEDNAK